MDVHIRRALVIGVTSAVFAALLAVAPTPFDGAAGAAADDVEFGVAVFGDEAALLTQVEADLGRNVDVVRNFALWDDTFPSPDDGALLQDGRKMILSVKPKATDGPIPWADIASAQPGDQLHQHIVDWANALKPYEDQIWLSFHHEPEASANIPYGNADEFKAAWRNFMTIVTDAGLSPIGRVWIMTDYSFQLPPEERRHAATWYPGNEWVEAIAGDAYNWYDCRDGVEIDWLDLADIIEAQRLFGAAHPHEELMLAEYGSVEDVNDPNRKAQWFADAQDLFKQPGYGQFTVVAYFSLHHDQGIFDCDWKVDSSSASLAAFTAMGDDPHYGGDGTPIPPTTTTTTIPPAGGGCVGSVTGSDVDLTWDEVGLPIIRRDGAWLATLNQGDLAFTDVGAPAGATYEIRLWTNGGRTDLICVLTPPTPTTITTTVAPPPQPSCTGTLQADSVLLEWGLPGTNVVRRNGAWLASIDPGGTSYTDSNPPVGATYVIRNREGNNVVDYECTLDAEVPPPPPVVGCSRSDAADGVTLSWDLAGDVIVRKNGGWLTTVNDGSVSFTDPAGTAADSYILRSWVTGVRVEYAC